MAKGLLSSSKRQLSLCTHAANLYPSTFGASTQDNKWIRKDLEVDSDDPKVIRAAGIANLRKNAYPAITYEVDGFVDVEIGDTITITIRLCSITRRKGCCA